MLSRFVLALVASPLCAAMISLDHVTLDEFEPKPAPQIKVQIKVPPPPQFIEVKPVKANKKVNLAQPQAVDAIQALLAERAKAVQALQVALNRARAAVAMRPIVVEVPRPAPQPLVRLVQQAERTPQDDLAEFLLANAGLPVNVAPLRQAAPSAPRQAEAREAERNLGTLEERALAFVFEFLDELQKLAAAERCDAAHVTVFNSAEYRGLMASFNRDGGLKKAVKTQIDLQITQLQKGSGLSTPFAREQYEALQTAREHLFGSRSLEF